MKGKTIGEVSIWLLLPTFFCAGFLNGLSGVGGGMILGVALPLLLGAGGTKKSFSYIALAVFLFSLVSAAVYLSLGRMTLNGVGETVLPALLGGAIGGLLLQRIDPILLKCLFAGLLLYAGVRFLWG